MTRWWESSVFYQIYPRSFCDTSGDGVGDLPGVIAHLDHLVWLGVDAIWLSPFFTSPGADFGYDVSDYCGIDPLFGTLDDFDRLVEEAHRRSMKVTIDWVPNHTSNLHPWFIESRSSRTNAKRDWYCWRDDRPDGAGGSGPPGSPGRRPNNWLAAFTGVGSTSFPPAWTWDDTTQQWYLHLFLAEQPDLNWSNPDVAEAMAGVLRFWLDRGVDGFRIDVVHALGKPDLLEDLPAELAAIPACAVIDDPSVQPVIAFVRSVVDEYRDPTRMVVGETVLRTVEQIPPYYGTPDARGLNLAFNFKPLNSPWDAAAWRQRVDESEQVIGADGRWPTWVLSNHDNPRHLTRYGTEGRARAAAVLLLTLRGTPFLYAGEELGLADADVAPAFQVDPGGRDGCRAPLPWDAGPDHGWAGGSRAWLPWPPESDSGRDMESAASDPSSTLNLYRRLLQARRDSPALRHGSFAWLSSESGTLAYTRSRENDLVAIGVNFTTEPSAFELPDGVWDIRVSSESGRQGTCEGSCRLGADEAVILSRRGG